MAGQLCLGLIQRRLGGLQIGFIAFHLGSADEVLCTQGAKALHIGLRQIALRGCRCHLRPCGFRAELIVPRIQPRQHLTSLHTLAQFYLALDDLAAHTKAKARLHPRTHITGKLLRRFNLSFTHRQQLHGPHRLGQRLLL